jgi:hypothetical protein
VGWRRVNNVLHRDIGYLVVGLTLVYAISGIAVNHVGDFNPNYREVRRDYTFEPISGVDRDTEVRHIVDRLGLPEPVDAFRPEPGRLQIIYEGWRVDALPAEGTATSLKLESRPFLHAVNRLHLNHLKGAWTWFADLYAVALIFMAISGMLVLRGRTGLGGRGKWLVGIGVLFPVLALLLAGLIGGS